MNIRTGKCGHVIEFRMVKPAVKGAVAVEVGICAWCDRRKCAGCGRQILDGHAQRCGWCGRGVRLNAKP